MVSLAIVYARDPHAHQRRRGGKPLSWTTKLPLEEYLWTPAIPPKHVNIQNLTEKPAARHGYRPLLWCDFGGRKGQDLPNLTQITGWSCKRRPCAIEFHFGERRLLLGASFPHFHVGSHPGGDLWPESHDMEDFLIYGNQGERIVEFAMAEENYMTSLLVRHAQIYH